MLEMQSATVEKRICPTCDAIFTPEQPHYDHCSYRCYRANRPTGRQAYSEDWKRRYQLVHHWLWEHSGALAPYLNWRPDQEQDALEFEFDRLVWRDQ